MAKPKWRILELLVNHFMEDQGYRKITDAREFEDVDIEGEKTWLRGLGTRHEIDAMGVYRYTVPFIYPIRLLSEAKCKSDPIGPAIVREMVGVMADVKTNTSGKKWEDPSHSRYMDAGAIFSTSKFSYSAQKLAYTHGIFLINVDALIKHIERLRTISAYEGYSDFESDILESYLDEADLYLYFGITEGNIPIAISSGEQFPKELFTDTDSRRITIHVEAAGGEIQRFYLNLDDWRGRFVLPSYIWSKNFYMPEERAETLDTKEEQLNSIKIPLRISGVHRVIDLELDSNFVAEQRRHIEQWRDEFYLTQKFVVQDAPQNRHDVVHLTALGSGPHEDFDDICGLNPDAPAELVDKFVNLENQDTIRASLREDVWNDMTRRVDIDYIE